MSEKKPTVMLISKDETILKRISSIMRVSFDVNIKIYKEFPEANIVIDNETTVAIIDLDTDGINEQLVSDRFEKLNGSIPLICLSINDISDPKILEYYKNGSLDYILKNDLENSSHIILNRINMLFKIQKVLSTLEEEIESKNLANQKLRNNMWKYTELLEGTNTAYVVLDENRLMIEANKVFAEILSLRSVAMLLGESPLMWIKSQVDKDKFSKYLNSLLENEKTHDIEIRLSSEYKSAWVSISGYVMENGGKSIFLLIKNISFKKMVESQKSIEQQKRKDKLKQTIAQVREKLSYSFEK